jgi:hypothetical protein
MTTGSPSELHTHHISIAFEPLSGEIRLYIIGGGMKKTVPSGMAEVFISLIQVKI